MTDVLIPCCKEKDVSWNPVSPFSFLIFHEDKTGRTRKQIPSLPLPLFFCKQNRTILLFKVPFPSDNFSKALLFFQRIVLWWLCNLVFQKIGLAVMEAWTMTVFSWTVLSSWSHKRVAIPFLWKSLCTYNLSIYPFSSISPKPAMTLFSTATQVKWDRKDRSHFFKSTFPVAHLSNCSLV